MRRLIQQQAQSEAGLAAGGELSELAAGVQSLAAELGDGGFTDLGLPPDDGQHASGWVHRALETYPLTGD